MQQGSGADLSLARLCRRQCAQQGWCPGGCPGNLIQWDPGEMQPAPARKSEDRCKIRETVVWFAYITYAALRTRLAAASHTQPPCRKGLCRAQALYAERCSDCSTRERAIAERTRLTKPVLSSAATPGKKYTMAQHGCFPACTRCQRPGVLLDPESCLPLSLHRHAGSRTLPCAPWSMFNQQA